MDFELICEGLEFPEGPIAMADGSVILTEIKGQRLTRVQRHRPHLVEEDERADHPPMRRGQRAAYRKTIAQIAHRRQDDGLDAVDVGEALGHGRSLFPLSASSEGEGLGWCWTLKVFRCASDA